MPRATQAVLVLGLVTALAVLCGVVLLSEPADAVVSVTPSGISPANATTGVAITGVPLSVTVVVNNAPHVTIRWYSSPTGTAGTWTLRGSATNVHNGTHKINTTWVTEYDTVYFWRLTYTTTAGTTGGVYHFTTRDSTTIHIDDRTDILNLLIWVGVIGIIVSAAALVMESLMRSRPH
jgi:hypothetical protein